MSAKLKLILGSGFGSGYARFAPGTWGSLAAIGVGWISINLAGLWSLPVLLILSVAAGYYSAGLFVQKYGEDPSSFVMDEWSGQFIALHVLFFLPQPATPFENYGMYLAAFLLFRFFDILKPLGIRSLEKLKGATGIIFDDLLAGLYTFLTLIIVIFAFL